ncbi:MAG: carbohydrate porin, partial [Bacteroidota bacterium]|nr:carbohydrate porin [Bacteroidota bacterium]
ILGMPLLGALCSYAQEDSSHRFSLHAQSTVIPQYHGRFSSPYSGSNSLESSEPVRTSVSFSGFLAYKPFRHTYFVFNPEAAGGRGLSKTLGIAGFPNGEVYRVGDPQPKPFIARLYAEQRIPLSQRKIRITDDQNQIAEYTNQDYLSVIAGKFSLTDFFDDSQVSHDPRTQFMNWSLMGNGAWDYPANTRGYTLGMVVQLLYHDWAIRTAMTAIPIEANGPELQFKWGKAMGWVLEAEKTHLFQKDEAHFTTLHAGIYLNKARMGDYQLAIQQAGNMPPDITQYRSYGRTKWGYYASLDNHFGNLHHFIKLSWNDGQNESWAFTEIDRSLATGIQLDGMVWKRKQDKLGIAWVSNGISPVHRQYLSKGGYGFLIGDGQLKYGHENILEIYYSWQVNAKISLSPDFQYISHPAYNKDRGPVAVWALRFHLEL